MSKRQDNPFIVFQNIIKTEGKDKKQWELLKNLIGKESKIQYYLITELSHYISNNNFNQEIIYDILDYIIDNCTNLPIINYISDIQFIGLLCAIIQKHETSKDVKIKILFLFQKWKNINENFLYIYNKIRNLNTIILPPKKFQIDTYKKFLNEGTDPNANNTLDNQPNDNESQKRNLEERNEFRLLDSQILELNSIMDSNKNLYNLQQEYNNVNLNDKDSEHNYNLNQKNNNQYNNYPNNQYQNNNTPNNQHQNNNNSSNQFNNNPNYQYQNNNTPNNQYQNNNNSSNQFNNNNIQN